MAGSKIVHVWLTDGATHRWALPPGQEPEDALEELRHAIVSGQWFRLPESGRVYSPYAIVAVEIADRPLDHPHGGLARRAGEAVADVFSPDAEPAG
jgi:hypothetical protein